MNDCNTCAFSYNCTLKDTNLAPDCGNYAEESDEMKKIKRLITITDELFIREYSFNCVITGSWNEICDEAIQLLKELKIND